MRLSAHTLNMRVSVCMYASIRERVCMCECMCKRDKVGRGGGAGLSMCESVVVYKSVILSLV